MVDADSLASQQRGSRPSKESGPADAKPPLVSRLSKSGAAKEADIPFAPLAGVKGRMFDRVGGRQAEVVRAFLEAIAPEGRPFDVRLWDGTLLPGDPRGTFTIVLNDPTALANMLTIPLEKSLATAYVAGRFDVEGDIIAAFRHVETFATRARATSDLRRLVTSLLVLPRAWSQDSRAPQPARLAGRKHSRGRDRAAIRHHYDVGNEFYAL